MRRRGVGDLVLGDIGDHFAAALVGLHVRQQIIFAVKRADARRTVQLVAGGHVEIAIERLHVDDFMHGALAAVDQNLGSDGMGEAGDLCDRVIVRAHSTCGVMATILVFGDSNFAKGGEIEGISSAIGAHSNFAPLRSRRKFQGRFGMVLHFRNDDFVAFDDVGAETGRDEIDPPCRLS